VHVLQLGTQRTRCERHVTPQGTHGGTITDQESLVSYKVYRCGCSGL